MTSNQSLPSNHDVDDDGEEDKGNDNNDNNDDDDDLDPLACPARGLFAFCLITYITR